MKIVIFGYGFQGKKHHAFWETQGAEICIVTSSGKHPDTIPFCQFQKTYDFNEFDMCIIAVFPTSEQEKVIEYLLSEKYHGYCIIEKPVAFSRELLIECVHREKTIFFIDETFSSCKFPTGEKDILVGGEHADDYQNIYEHAIGWFLQNEDMEDVLKNVSLSTYLSKFMEYQIQSRGFFLEFSHGDISSSGSVPIFLFDELYKQLVFSIRNEVLHLRIRKNFLLARDYFINNSKK